MTELQLDFTFLGLIILMNIIITFLYKKYKDQKLEDEKGIDLGNTKVVDNINPNSFSFMPRIPLLILKRHKSKSLSGLIIVHNILCLLVYGLFTAAIVVHFIKD